MTAPTSPAAPIDPTSTDAWAELEAHNLELEGSLREWFDTDPRRAERFTHDAAELHVDLSKNLLTSTTMDLLLQLAREVGVEERRDAMFAGAHINTTEDRAVLHTALRRPAGSSPSLQVDGQNIDEDVRGTLHRVYDFADKVRSGEWTGVTGKRIETVVNIGIGGSDLGPVMVYEALKPLAQEGLEARFISNIDPTDAFASTQDLDPETTLVIVASKTFTTQETLTNARLVRQWLLGGLRENAGLTAEQEQEAVAKHFVAVSTALDKVEAFGIDPENAFGFWDWVGGRYSVDSAIGTVLATVLGPDTFEELLAGFHAMDEHFAAAPAEQNVPLLMGLVNVWNVNFLEAETHAVLPYSQYLHRFPAYLQQLTMESNGKSVRWDGSLATTETGEVFWGEPGTNGQHAFYQLIHQGTRLIPADFIAFATPNHALVDGEQDVHELFLANFFAQTKALAFGKSAEEVRAEGTEGPLVAAREFSGDRPTTSIMAPKLTPSVLGQLIALYEHITFVQGVVWGLNSFDQWGVELGKQLAQGLAPAVAGDEQAISAEDASTAGLIRYYREQRQQG
ncbi:glucose-6-phosphate isomerase [Brachybacterium paraconglomeratum]|uniref:glucose-6-phosphate isomerase n=1 Tax=Brachybacterium paraconglomeratum TaxID=173362 RepID=UPI0031EDEED4